MKDNVLSEGDRHRFHGDKVSDGTLDRLLMDVSVGDGDAFRRDEVRRDVSRKNGTLLTTLHVPSA